jgi:hypothetical protein
MALVNTYAQDQIAYSIAALESKPLPEPFSPAVAAELVKSKRLTDKRFAIQTTVGAPNDLERAALMYLLAAHCGVASTGRQYRQVVPLGETGKVGQVILTYDQQLNGTATLVGRGLPLGGPPEGTSDKTLTERLIADHALSGVRGDWGAGELLKVSRALALTSPAERTALYGVALERVKILAEDDREHTTGRFVQEFGPNASGWGVIRLADAAFADDGDGFYGGDDCPARPPSFQTLLHEVGHVVESAVRRRASRNNALLALGTPDPTPMLPLSQAAVTAATTLKFEGIDQWEHIYPAAQAAMTAVSRKDREANQRIAACRALGGTAATLADALEVVKNTPTEVAVAQAIAIRQQLSDENDRLFDCMQLVLDLRTTLRGARPWITLPADFVKVGGFLSGLNHAPWQDFHDEISRYAGIQARSADWQRMYNPGGEPTTGRLTALATYVQAQGVPTDLTDYTKNKKSELYAEAYGTWRVHPEALGGHSLQLRAYFVASKHLNDD